MKKILFRFETVLNMRLAKEGAIKRDLEVAENKCNQLQQQNHMLDCQIAALMEEIQLKRQAGEWELQDTYGHILEQLRASQEQLSQTLQHHSKQKQHMQERLSEAIRARKVIEKIKEKHYASLVKGEPSEDSASPKKHFN